MSYCSNFSTCTGGSTVVQTSLIGLANDVGSMADLPRIGHEESCHMQYCHLSSTSQEGRHWSLGL